MGGTSNGLSYSMVTAIEYGDNSQGRTQYTRHFQALNCLN